MPPSGWHYYCASDKTERFKDIPPRCVRLHESQASAANAGGYRVVLTEDCAECGGAGCSGPFAGLLTSIARSLFGEPAKSPVPPRPQTRAEIRRALRRTRYLRNIEAQAPRVDAPPPGTIGAAASGYAWYLCSSKTFPTLPPRRVWLHSSQAAAANAGGASCILQTVPG